MIVEKCATCVHSFGEHFTTYDESRHGCIHYNSGDMREPGYRCGCSGFSVKFRPPKPQPAQRTVYGFGGPGEPYGT